MACFRPLEGWRSRVPHPVTGSYPIVFNFREAQHDARVTVPCGQCIGCRLERSRQWAVRCVHEAQTHESSCFITLTYDDAHLPPGGSLCLRDFQLFMKRLRKRFGKVRFFHCGEYGERFGRPHYHALLFGFDFPDRVPRGSREDCSSDILSELWPFGRVSVGDVTFNSAAYVARYITKKVTGERAASHYERVDEVTGECFSVVPEYLTMSRRPGIGRAFFDLYSRDIFRGDFVVMRGKCLRPPRFYDRNYELIYPVEFSELKFRRVSEARRKPELSSLRLHQMEYAETKRFEQFGKRNYEAG